MEILELNTDTITHISPAWDVWLIFDNRPRIVERGVDFSEDIGTIKRHLFTEVARRGLDTTVKVLHGDRLLFQVFSPDGSYPKLPELSDARKKHPWDLWLDGAEHMIQLEQASDVLSLRTYIYKKAKARGLKVRTTINTNELTIQAHKERT